MTFGEKLQYLRKSKGMSQEQLAGQVMVSRQAVSKWELDAAMPDTDNILQISKLFSVTTDYLLDNDIETTVPANEKPACFESKSEFPTGAVLETPLAIPKKAAAKKLIEIIQISLIVLAIYILTFAAAIMTRPEFLPFFAMIATSVSIIVVIVLSRKNRGDYA